MIFLEKKRFIFDLDDTLLEYDLEYEAKFFKDLFGEDAKIIIENMDPLMKEYSLQVKKFEYSSLAEYLKEKTGLAFTPSIIEEWVKFIGDMNPVLEDESIIPLLKELKKDGKSIVVLSNWFSFCQLKRLKNSGLNEYFETIFTADIYCKPNKEAYLLAMGSYPIEECIFIGDSLRNDYETPRKIGMDAILFDKNDSYPEEYRRIHSFQELIDHKEDFYGK